LPGIEPGSKVDSYEIREVVEKKTEGSGAYKDFRGVPVIGAYRWLPELEVALMAEQEQSESARSVSVMLAVNASVALAALLIATIASLAVTRGIASPLAELSDAAAQIAVGNLSITAEVQRKDEIGALAGTFNFMTDELRRTMTGLRKSEEKYRTLVDNVNIGIYRNTGGQGMFLQANPALAKIFGYDTVEELRQVAVADLYVDPEDRERFLEEVKRSGFVKDRKLALKKKDGTPIWCSVSATVQYGEYGEMEWMDGVLEDVTERKRAEEERERLLHDLTEAVATAKTLSGMLPICASCKRIRDDKGYWQQIEAYVSEHSEAEFSHGVCPECFKKLYPGYSMENLKTDKKDTA
jgi:PAS domain S-box-containing protein